MKTITGDNRFCAAHVAKAFNMRPDRILTGPEIAALSPEALMVKAKDAEVFAEIGPDQKELIVRALQKGAAAVAYMGDGINDVAAINAADAGISVNDAVDVAREAADVVLLEKDLTVLADGIREGRRTFANTLKYILINTGATFGNMFSVAIASLILPYLPMLPTQILLTNFLTDLPYMAVSSDNVDEEQVQRPGRWDLRTIRSFMVIFGLHSTLFDVCTFLVLFSWLRVSEGLFQTGWFLESVVTELFILFIIRTRRSVLKSTPGRSLTLFSVLAFLLTIGLIYAPFDTTIELQALPARVIGPIAVILLLYVITADLLKRWFFKRLAT
ncbi:MAG: HAD-IC family P-type ATPase [Flavobacteriales bacterium]